MSIILAIDPGPTHSAWVLLVEGKPVAHAKEENEVVLEQLRAGGIPEPVRFIAIEMIASYGMPVGREIFETCVWIGRFQEAWEHFGGQVQLIYRRDVKLFHCGSARAKDANIRQSLIDRFGGKEAAIGRKACPGPLFGITADRWSALALAITAANG